MVIGGHWGSLPCLNLENGSAGRWMPNDLLLCLMTQRGDPVGIACHKTPPVGVVHPHPEGSFASAPLSLPKSYLCAAAAGIAALVCPKKVLFQPLPGLSAASEPCRMQTSFFLLLLSQNREPVLFPSPKQRDGNPEGDASHSRGAAQLSSWDPIGHGQWGAMDTGRPQSRRYLLSVHELIKQ